MLLYHVGISEVSCQKFSKVCSLLNVLCIKTMEIDFSEIYKNTILPCWYIRSISVQILQKLSKIDFWWFFPWITSRLLTNSAIDHTKNSCNFFYRTLGKFRCVQKHTSKLCEIRDLQNISFMYDQFTRDFTRFTRDFTRDYGVATVSRIDKITCLFCRI